MKHNIDKMAAIFIASIFALSGLGIAYAAWTDTITIDGSVTTGTLRWEFGSVTVQDDDQPINPGGDWPTDDPDLTCHPGFTYDPIEGFFWELDKNVAWAEAERKDLDGVVGYETLEVTLHNVYPCNFNEFSFYLHNIGTIPLRIDHIIINGVKYNSGTPHILFDLDGNGQDDFEIKWNNNWGAQWEPDVPATWEISFWTHVLQDEGSTIQGESFTFQIQVVCVQWNEYPLP